MIKHGETANPYLFRNEICAFNQSTMESWENSELRIAVFIPSHHHFLFGNFLHSRGNRYQKLKVKKHPQSNDWPLE